MKNYFILGIIIFALIFQIGCAKKETPTTPTPVTDEKGSVYLSIQNAPAQISTTTGYVYATNMDTVLSNLTKSGSTITGTITNIPVGNSRYLRIDAMDSSGLLIYRGTSSVFSVSVNQTTQVSIILYALTGNVQVNGTVDTGSIPTEGLMAYYPFNGNANDASGNSNNGTVIGGATLTTDRFGNANTAYLFDGVDDYIDVLNSQSLQIQGNSFTISAWIKPSIEIDLNYAEGIIIVRKGAWTDGYVLQTVNNSNYGQGLHVGANLTEGWRYFVGEPHAWHMNEWHFLTVLYDGTIFKGYINGIEELAVVAHQSSNNLSIGTTRLRIGANTPEEPGGPNSYFPGTIDDIRIYNRVLTQLEIQSLFREGGWTGQ